MTTGRQERESHEPRPIPAERKSKRPFMNCDRYRRRRLTGWVECRWKPKNAGNIVAKFERLVRDCRRPRELWMPGSKGTPCPVSGTELRPRPRDKKIVLPGGATPSHRTWSTDRHQHSDHRATHLVRHSGGEARPQRSNSRQECRRGETHVGKLPFVPFSRAEKHLTGPHFAYNSFFT